MRFSKSFHGSYFGKNKAEKGEAEQGNAGNVDGATKNPLFSGGAGGVGGVGGRGDDEDLDLRVKSQRVARAQGAVRFAGAGGEEDDSDASDLEGMLLNISVYFQSIFSVKVSLN
jgi:hypothetical protein